MISVREQERRDLQNSLWVGKIVHYRSFGTSNGEYSSMCRAAVIAEVHEDGDVTVVVLNPSGYFFNKVKHDHFEMSAGGTWHDTICCVIGKHDDSEYASTPTGGETKFMVTCQRCTRSREVPEITP